MAIARATASLRFDRDGAVARITLDRQHVGNAIDLDLARALLRAAIACDEDDTIRCVVLAGTGHFFCTGGDIAAFASAGDAISDFLQELAAELHAAMFRLARMSKPLVTAINGPAAGAGVSLAALGDIALATASAHFTLAYTAIGLSPDGGSTWLLPRLIGLRRTQELALLNRRLGAEEAARYGLVTRAVPDGTLEAEVDRVAGILAQSATHALGRTRNLLLSSFATTIETQMELETRSITDASRGAENREGVRAFLEKRNPNFM